VKTYEVIREIFNECSGNQMRDVFISEVAVDDTDEYVKSFCTGTIINIIRTDRADGTIVYDIETDGMQQRIGFCEC